MSQKDYRACMAKGMQGKTLTKEERKLEFCTLAKLCSKKTSSREEAQRMCSLPKPPKTTKERGVRRRKEETCETRVIALSRCIAENIDMDQVSNVNSIEMALANALMKCECGE